MWVVGGLVLVALVLPGLWPQQEGEKLTYTQFMTQVRAGEVESVVVNNSTNTISGTLDRRNEVLHHRRR